MKISANLKANTVSAINQLSDKIRFIGDDDADAVKVLFVGNSITRHGPKADIGWTNDWGMAASSEENDYVHVTINELKKKYGKVYACTAQISLWEIKYWDGDKILEDEYDAARQFSTDIVIIRMGENIRYDKNKEINCKPYFDRMIKFFISNNPNAKVVVTNCFWENEEYHRIFSEVALENNYIFCSLQGLENIEGSMALGLFEHRGVAHHPSDYGMKLISEKIIESLKL